MLLDTSALLEGEREGKILFSVIQELDHLKNKDGLIGKKARDVIKFIYLEALDNVINDLDFLPNETIVDRRLLAYAKEYGLKLITADLSLYLQADASDVDAEFIISNQNARRIDPSTTYLTAEQYVEVLEGRFVHNLHDNHILIYADEAFRVVGGQLVEIKYRTIHNKWSDEIKPRNVEQKCLIDLLYSNIPVVAVHSKYGCGKSFLMLNYILEALEKEKISKLIVIPNNSIVANTREIGTLPGNLIEKEFVYLGPLVDLLGKAEVEALIALEKLEILPLSVARGRNLTDAIVWVSEAQNLTAYHLKLLIGRLGENTRIFFDGDVRQEDNKVFTESSGLVLLHKLSKTAHASMFGSVELKVIERSKTAQLADVLDSLE